MNDECDVQSRRVDFADETGDPRHGSNVASRDHEAEMASFLLLD